MQRKKCASKETHCQSVSLFAATQNAYQGLTVRLAPAVKNHNAREENTYDQGQKSLYIMVSTENGYAEKRYKNPFVKKDSYPQYLIFILCSKFIIQHSG